MDFLVDFDIRVPEGALGDEVAQREQAEAAAAAKLADEGHVLRIWKRPAATGGSTVLGLYRANDASELEGLLRNLPMYQWMKIEITPLERHPNDPVAAQPPVATGPRKLTTSTQLPAPQLSLVYRLEASLGQPFDLGDVAGGHRRIVPLTGGTFSGPSISGKLLAGASADWQVAQPDGTTLADLRYTLQTDEGAVLYVQAAGVRHGPPAVLGRIARGEDVDASEYTFRTGTRIETAAAKLDWLNKGVFISVGGREPGRVIYETYLVA